MPPYFLLFVLCLNDARHAAVKADA